MMISQDWEYKIQNGSDGPRATLLSYTGPSKDIFIPAKIDGIPVQELFPALFSNRKIRSLTFDNDCRIEIIPHHLCANQDTLKTVTLPDSIKIIGAFAFYSCTQLKTINTPKNLEEINLNAFFGCLLLETLPISENIKKIGPEAFMSTLSAKHGVSLPPTFQEYISPETFAGSGITSIDMSRTRIKNIGENAFLSSAVQYVILSPYTKELHSSCFRGCDYLSCVRGGNNVEWIQTKAFAEIKSKLKLRLPSLNHVAPNAFKDSKSVTIRISPEQKDIIKVLNFQGVNIEYIHRSSLKAAVKGFDEEER